jgi:hypothetical protein
MEQQFMTAWGQLTDAMRERCGSAGSRLHRSDDGTFVGYAVWPSRQVRDACRHDSALAVAAMRDSATEAMPPEYLEILDDRLASPAPRTS